MALANRADAVAPAKSYQQQEAVLSIKGAGGSPEAALSDAAKMRALEAEIERLKAQTSSASSNRAAGAGGGAAEADMSCMPCPYGKNRRYLDRGIYRKPCRYYHDPGDYYGDHSDPKCRVCVVNCFQIKLRIRRVGSALFSRSRAHLIRGSPRRSVPCPRVFVQEQ